ncbi:MAG: hypothetical protein IJE97_04375 [Thermoguttaceae bacterium]|nr:hypothetical protein [Thermoguttaceae bacterium]
MSVWGRRLGSTLRKTPDLTVGFEETAQRFAGRVREFAVEVRRLRVEFERDFIFSAGVGKRGFRGDRREREIGVFDGGALTRLCGERRF